MLPLVRGIAVTNQQTVVGTVGHSAHRLNLGLLYTCCSQPELVLPPALLSPTSFPHCPLLCCGGNIWELLTCRAHESRARRQEAARRKTQVILRGAGAELGQAWGWQLAWCACIARGHPSQPPRVSCTVCGSVLVCGERRPIPWDHWVELCWCCAVLGECASRPSLRPLCLPSVTSGLGQPCCCCFSPSPPSSVPPAPGGQASHGA